MHEQHADMMLGASESKRECAHVFVYNSFADRKRHFVISQIVFGIYSERFLWKRRIENGIVEERI